MKRMKKRWASKFNATYLKHDQTTHENVHMSYDRNTKENSKKYHS